MAIKKLILLARTYEAGRDWIQNHGAKHHDPHTHSWFVYDTEYGLVNYLRTMTDGEDVSGYMMKDFRENPECGKMLVALYEHKEKIRPELAIKFFDDLQKHL